MTGDEKTAAFQQQTIDGFIELLQNAQELRIYTKKLRLELIEARLKVEQTRLKIIEQRSKRINSKTGLLYSTHLA